MSLYSYNLIQEQLSPDITFEKYKKILLKIINRKKYNTISISEVLSLGANTAQIISLIIQVFIQARG